MKKILQKTKKQIKPIFPETFGGWGFLAQSSPKTLFFLVLLFFSRFFGFGGFAFIRARGSEDVTLMVDTWINTATRNKQHSHKKQTRRATNKKSTKQQEQQTT